MQAKPTKAPRNAKRAKPEAAPTIDAEAATPATVTEAAPATPAEATQAAAPTDPDKRRNPDKKRTLGNLTIPTEAEAVPTISGNVERYRSVIAELTKRYGSEPFAFSTIRTIRFAADATSCKTRVLGDAAVISRLIGGGYLASTDGENLTITGKRV